MLVGDALFDAPRRMLSEVAAKAGVKAYGYQFTHPQPLAALGGTHLALCPWSIRLCITQTVVCHGCEVQFVFGQVPPTGPNNIPPSLPAYGNADEAARNLSTIMMDYWISFTVSLDPNDGKGIQRQLLA